jgi:hypothetical protein
VSYGIECRLASGALMFSSLSHKGAVMAEIYEVASGAATYTRSYPEWTGRTGFAFDMNGVGAAVLTCTWSYPSGVPTLQIVRGSDVLGVTTTLTVYVFMK